MERISPASQPLNLDSSPKFFRPQAAMHHPLLKPLCLERSGRRLGYKRRDGRAAKCTEAHLRYGALRPGDQRLAAAGIKSGSIGISRVNGIPAACDHKKCHQVRLKQHIYVHVLAEVPSIAAEKQSARRYRLSRLKSVLNIQPILERGPEVDIRGIGIDSLINLLGAES